MSNILSEISNLISLYEEMGDKRDEDKSVISKHKGKLLTGAGLLGLMALGKYNVLPPTLQTTSDALSVAASSVATDTATAARKIMGNPHIIDILKGDSGIRNYITQKSRLTHSLVG